jgi:hypothetical protein
MRAVADRWPSCLAPSPPPFSQRPGRPTRGSRGYKPIQVRASWRRRLRARRTGSSAWKPARVRAAGGAAETWSRAIAARRYRRDNPLPIRVVRVGGRCAGLRSLGPSPGRSPPRKPRLPLPPASRTQLCHSDTPSGAHTRIFTDCPTSIPFVINEVLLVPRMLVRDPN